MSLFPNTNLAAQLRVLKHELMLRYSYDAAEYREQVGVVPDAMLEVLYPFVVDEMTQRMKAGHEDHYPFIDQKGWSDFVLNFSGTLQAIDDEFVNLGVQEVIADLLNSFEQKYRNVIVSDSLSLYWYPNGLKKDAELIHAAGVSWSIFALLDSDLEDYRRFDAISPELFDGYVAFVDAFFPPVKDEGRLVDLRKISTQHSLLTAAFTLPDVRQQMQLLAKLVYVRFCTPEASFDPRVLDRPDVAARAQLTEDKPAVLLAAIHDRFKSLKAMRVLSFTYFAMTAVDNPWGLLSNELVSRVKLALGTLDLKPWLWDEFGINIMRVENRFKRTVPNRGKHKIDEQVYELALSALLEVPLYGFFPDEVWVDLAPIRPELFADYIEALAYQIDRV